VLLNILTNYHKWHTGGVVTLNNFGLGQVLSHVFLVHNFFQSTISTISGPFWTIAVEAQFYLLYLLARPFFFSPKGWFFSFVVAIALHLGGMYLISRGHEFQPWHALQFWIEWVLGAYIAYSLRTRYHVTRYWYVWFVLCVACWILAGHFKILGSNAFWGNSQYLIVASLAFLTLLLFHWEKMWSWRGLRWIPFLGTFSYSIYLIHFLMLDRVRVFIIPALSPGVARMSISLLAMLVSLVISYVFFRYFEKPFMEKSANWKAWDKID